jgi:hypothetical protein
MIPDHEMLLSVLERYGAPPKFVSAVQKMYKNNIVILKIEKESVEMRQTVGVRQGDNMAPVKFLFMMNTFAESLETVWKQKGIPVLRVMTTNADTIEDGQICSHTQAMYKSKSLTMFEIFQCLYDDDGAFPFETREDMIQGMNLIYHHFARFGLEMHIGRNGKESKTECVFFPPPQFIVTKVSQTNITAAAPTTIDITNTVTPTTDMIDTITPPTDISTETPINNPTDFPIGSRINVINHLKYGGKHGIVKGHTPKFVIVEISDMNKAYESTQNFFSTAPMTTKPFSQSVIAPQLIDN